MIVYEAIKSEFIKDVESGFIDQKIQSLMMDKLGRHVSLNEVRSWSNSLGQMHMVLYSDDVPSNCGVAIEYKIPNTGKRVDLIVSGRDEDSKYRAIIIELKQWSDVKKVDSQDAIVQTFLNGRLVNTTHPSYQAWSYASLIYDYNESIRDEKVEIFPCAYLHNYGRSEKDDPLFDGAYTFYLDKAPAFVKGDAIKLREFISRYIKFGDNKEVLYYIEHGKIKPSKSLQDSVRNMIAGNQEFLMIDEQKVVYERAKELALKCFEDGRKRVYIVKGGPGTGKSVLAINLLSELLNMEKNVLYVTKNLAPREVFLSKLKKNKIRNVQINNLFSGSGSFTETHNNYFDSLIVDEAHRLNEKSGMFSNLGENQVKEIIISSKFSIFFIDERQKIHMKDNGSIEEIRKWANKYHAEIIEDELVSQFRCNGSDGYLAWIDNVLQIRETANETFDLDFDYDFKVVDTPQEVRDYIFEKNKINNKARMIAGYCWDWDKINKNNPDHHDIVIDKHDFKMSWNLGNTATYAIDEESVNQIGCIHTTQGLEFDYVGIIIGEDMRFENGQVITDLFKRAKTDQSIKGLKGLYKKNPGEAMRIADEIIKNTYRTLLTRGQKGCVVYCVDEELNQHLKEMVGQL